jgi:hypothetical protein
MGVSGSISDRPRSLTVTDEGDGWAAVLREADACVGEAVMAACEGTKLAARRWGTCC